MLLLRSLLCELLYQVILPVQSHKLRIINVNYTSNFSSVELQGKLINKESYFFNSHIFHSYFYEFI